MTCQSGFARRCARSLAFAAGVAAAASSAPACGRSPAGIEPASGHSTLAIGSAAPAFSLPGVDGATHTLADYASARVLAVVFTCNHCPASQAYESRLNRIDADYRSKGVALVAIDPDNARSIAFADLGYTDVTESLADMKTRAASRHLTYAYLYDGDAQTVATAFGVAATPEIFLFDADRRLRYAGRIDDNVREDLVKTHDAREAIDALMRSQPVKTARTPVSGCPMPWLSPSSAAKAETTALDAEPVRLDMAGADALKTLRGNGTGALTIVNFWATWCGPCVAEFADLQDTYRMYRSRGLRLVTVSENDPDEKPGVVSFLQKEHASSRNLQFATHDVYALQVAFDPMMSSAVPFTVLLAPNGDVLYQETGELDILKLRRAILANLPEDEAHHGQHAYWSGN